MLHQSADIMVAQRTAGRSTSLRNHYMLEELAKLLPTTHSCQGIVQLCQRFGLTANEIRRIVKFPSVPNSAAIWSFLLGMTQPNAFMLAGLRRQKINSYKQSAQSRTICETKDAPRQANRKTRIQRSPLITVRRCEYL